MSTRVFQMLSAGSIGHDTAPPGVPGGSFGPDPPGGTHAAATTAINPAATAPNGRLIERRRFPIAFSPSSGPAAAHRSAL